MHVMLHSSYWETNKCLWFFVLFFLSPEFSSFSCWFLVLKQHTVLQLGLYFNLELQFKALIESLIKALVLSVLISFFSVFPRLLCMFLMLILGASAWWLLLIRKSCSQKLDGQLAIFKSVKRASSSHYTWYATSLFHIL